MGNSEARQGTETGYLVVFVTASGSEEAHKIATELLEQRKAACINIVPAINSLFRWQGKIESEQESLLVIKTRASLLDEVIDLVNQVHSYDVAEVIALPIVGGNRDYLEWIGGEVA